MLYLQIGDPKDSVRNGVKALINQINRLYPVSKLFTYVMEGVKSKNARQRAECLEVMGSIIEDFGIYIKLHLLMKFVTVLLYRNYSLHADSSSLPKRSCQTNIR